MIRPSGSPTLRSIASVAALLILAGAVAACSVVGDDDEQSGPSSTISLQPDSDAEADAADGATGADSVDPVELPSATVGLVILAEVPTLTLTRTGFLDSVGDCDVVDIEVVERDAEGELSALTPAVESMLTRGVDMIATIATPTAITANEVVGARGGTTPVVYATVTDPFSAGLADDPSTHESWITGSASPPPFEAVMDATESIVPGVSVLGVIRNPEESNSRFAVDGIQRAADERNWSVELVEVDSAAEIGDAIQELIDRGIDVFIAPTDTTVNVGLPTIAAVAAENDLPVIGIDPNQADNGAAIAIGSDYYSSGFRAGGIACRVLGGEALPADFDVIDIEAIGVTINEEQIEAQNVTIPADLREVAELSDE